MIMHGKQWNKSNVYSFLNKVNVALNDSCSGYKLLLGLNDIL